MIMPTGIIFHIHGILRCISTSNVSSFGRSGEHIPTEDLHILNLVFNKVLQFLNDVELDAGNLLYKIAWRSHFGRGQA
jgi:hypothetical protein